jgi:anti-sigma factor RsiW
MMTKRTDISDEDVHAFIDGELDELRRAAVDATIAGDPALGAFVERYRADKARIANVYGGGLEKPLPRHWVATINERTKPSRWISVGVPAMALAASFLLVFALATFRQNAVPANGDIVAEALAVRNNEVGPQAMIAVNTASEAHVQDVAMTRALAAHVKVPDLERLGYRLVGIETFDSPVRSFELVYRNRDAHAFTLYVRRSPGGTRFDQFARNGLRICVWQDDSVATVMAGKMSNGEMQRLASLAYNGLTL